MESAGRGLDEVVGLLGRWSGTSGPAERLQVVTEAARVLRDLPSTDSRVLARQLFEHGAPNAAQKIAQQTGGAVSADQLNDAAYALLSVDQRELDGLARELRDPAERRRIFEEAGVALRAATDTPPPPQRGSHLPIPPPPGARASAQRDPAPVEREPAPVERDPAPVARGPVRDDDAAARDDRGGEPDDGGGAPDDDAPPQDGGSGSDTGSGPDPAGSAARSTAPVATRRGRATPMSRFVTELSGAQTGRERLALLDQHRMDLDHQQLVEVLQAVPDGWQRRTALRKLLTARRVDPLDDASDVVTSFARRSDRFAVAASLTRSGIADVVPLLAHLDPADARRLRRRYTA